MSDSTPLPGDPASGIGRTAPARTARTKPAEVVLVCRKCARRLGLSGKEARRLAKAACRAASEAACKAAGAQGGRQGDTQGCRKAKVVETGCLGPCPKRLLAVATGASLAAGRVALLDPRADPPAALPDFGPNARIPAEAGAGAQGGGHGSARDRAATLP